MWFMNCSSGNFFFSKKEKGCIFFCTFVDSTNDIFYQLWSLCLQKVVTIVFGNVVTFLFYILNKIDSLSSQGHFVLSRGGIGDGWVGQCGLCVCAACCRDHWSSHHEISSKDLISRTIKATGDKRAVSFLA